MNQRRQPDRDRQEQILRTVLKVVGSAIAIGLMIGFGTWILVKAIGLDNTDTGGGPVRVEPRKPSTLPTSAIPQPSTSADPTDEPSGDPTSTSSAAPGSLTLDVSPPSVSPMGRINLAGEWPGNDNVPLLVQRFENGAWVDFGVQVVVRVGAFETYVQTSHEGVNRFRVYDPSSDTASNEVRVTIG